MKMQSKSARLMCSIASDVEPVAMTMTRTPHSRNARLTVPRSTSLSSNKRASGMAARWALPRHRTVLRHSLKTTQRLEARGVTWRPAKNIVRSQKLAQFHPVTIICSFGAYAPSNGALTSEGSNQRQWHLESRARANRASLRIRDVRSMTRANGVEMRPRANTAGNLTRLDPSRQQRVSNQRSMTTPGHRLGAHQHDALLLRQVDATLQAVFELRGLHVVGIATEAGIAPTGVRRVGPRTPQAAQPGHVSVVDLRAVQSRRQLVAIELGIVSRARDRPHVDDALDAVRLEEAEEFVDRARGMPDREDHQGRHITWLVVPLPRSSLPYQAIVRRNALS